MSRFFFFTSFIFLLSIGSTMQAQTQNGQNPVQNQTQVQSNAQTQVADLDKPQTLVQQLSLTRDQIQQIRQINRDTAEARKAANQRQNQARQSLDAVIYGDAPKQVDVDQKLRELTEAQVAATTLRVQLAYRIRQILLPEQLTKLIELRQRAALKTQQTNRIFQNKQLPKVQ